jgi:hypothetical protein
MCLTIASPQPGTAGFARACPIDAVEALEDAIPRVRRNSGTIIRDGYPDSGIVNGLRGYFHLAARFAVLDSVLDQVKENLLDAIGIGPHRRVLGYHIYQFHPLLCGQTGQILNGWSTTGRSSRSAIFMAVSPLSRCDSVRRSSIRKVRRSVCFLTRASLARRCQYQANAPGQTVTG